MPDYIELILSATLKEDTPQQVIDVLEWLCTGKNKPSAFPDSEVFRGDTEWMDGLFFYHDNAPDVFGRPLLCSPDKRRSKSKDLHISARCHINSRRHDRKLDLLLKWLRPYVSCGSGEYGIYAITIGDYGIPTLYCTNELKEYSYW